MRVSGLCRRNDFFLPRILSGIRNIFSAGPCHTEVLNQNRLFRYKCLCFTKALTLFPCLCFAQNRRTPHFLTMRNSTGNVIFMWIYHILLPTAEPRLPCATNPKKYSFLLLVQQLVSGKISIDEYYISVIPTLLQWGCRLGNIDQEIKLKAFV